MKNFLALTAVAAMALPMTATAGALPSGIEVGKTYICSEEAINANVSICGKVDMPSPASDLCVFVQATDLLRTSPVILNKDNQGQCAVAGALLNGGGATTTTAGLGGLAGAGPAIAVLVGGAAIAAASGGGNSNGTN